ncbi:MAG: SUMF1/EgtB/PvdO family nonheme iron enzyme [Deltaproteobacteria bacterium]|nr:SUMF1/EgtB/PvdO family nonheme iron enzyme [Deltaproteobacteria bacterium]
MLCYRCGSHVPDGSEFCPNCGQRFTAGVSKDEGKAVPADEDSHQYQFKAGDVIAGRYRIKGIIGSGGIGEVYRAHDSEIDVDVAVKVLHEGVITGEDDFRQFSTELKAARKLAHQNIVRVYDVDRDSGKVFYALQLLEGLTLRRIIMLRAEKNQVFSLQEVEPIFSQIVHALEHAHQFTFHGNLKPENVVILPDLLKVTDFFLIGALGRKKFLDRQKTDAGGLRYLAPEIRYEWDNVNNRADIFSLGAILSEMVTGEPYDGGPANPSARNRALPRSIDRLCGRALEEDPFKRHESVTEFLQELNRVIEESITGLSASEVAAPKTKEEEFLPEGEFEEIEDHEIEEIEGPARADAKPAADRGRRVSFGLEEEPRAAQSEGSAPRESRALYAAAGAGGPSAAPPDAAEAEDKPARPAPSVPPKKAEAKPAPARPDDKPIKPEQPRLPTAIVRAQKRHFTAILIMFLLVVLVIAGGSFFIWKQSDKDRRQRIAELAEIEEQRKKVDERQKKLDDQITQLLAAKKDAEEKVKAQEEEEKKIAVKTEPVKEAVKEAKEAKEEKPEPLPPEKKGPTEEEKNLADIEAKLAKIREQKEMAAQQKAELEAKKFAKAEERKAAMEEAKRKAEERKADLDARKAETEKAKAEEKARKEEEKKKSEEEAKKAAAAAKEPKCPRGMVLVPAGRFQFGSAAGDPMKGFGEKNNEPVDLPAYCIDIYEYPNGSGKLPRTGISYGGAEGACRKAAKRICTEQEWEKACKGPGGFRYPYGNKWEPAFCNSEDDQGNKKQVGPAGSFTKCRSGYGVADMSGNVAEWVNAGGAKANKGGAADRPNYAVRCAAKAAADPGKTSATLGFRCCAGAD